jgi:hypothetical protein
MSWSGLSAARRKGFVEEGISWGECWSWSGVGVGLSRSEM